MKETPPFVKNKKLYLGGKKKQKGGFFGLGTALGVGIPILAKLLGDKRKVRKRRRRW